MNRCNWALASYPRTVGMLPRGVCPDPECVRKYRKGNGIKDDVPVPPPENPDTASAAEGDAEKGQEGEASKVEEAVTPVKSPRRGS